MPVTHSFTVEAEVILAGVDQREKQVATVTISVGECTCSLISNLYPTDTVTVQTRQNPVSIIHPTSLIPGNYCEHDGNVKALTMQEGVTQPAGVTFVAEGADLEYSVTLSPGKDETHSPF